MKEVASGLEDRDLTYLFKLNINTDMKKLWLDKNSQQKNKDVTSIKQVKNMSKVAENHLKSSKDGSNGSVKLNIPKLGKISKNKFQLSSDIEKQNLLLEKIEEYLNDLSEVRNTFKKYSTSVKDSKFEKSGFQRSPSKKSGKNPFLSNSAQVEKELLEFKKENKELMKVILRSSQKTHFDKSLLAQKYQSVVGLKLEKIQNLEQVVQHLEKQNKILNLQNLQLSNLAHKNQSDTSSGLENSFSYSNAEENQVDICEFNIGSLIEGGDKGVSVHGYKSKQSVQKKKKSLHQKAKISKEKFNSQNMRTLIDKLSSQITISYEEFELAKSKMKKLDRKTVDQIDQIQTLMKFQNNQIAKTKSMCQLNI